jgi:hypothetical protein
MKEEIVSYAGSVKMFFFVAGIIATLAYRVIIVLNFYNPLWVKVSWYIGTVGFILYFGFRYDVQRRESKIVSDYGLLGVIDKTSIKGKQKKALKYILRTNLNSKARWNSLFICLLSILALLVGIVFDLGIFG